MNSGKGSTILLTIISVATLLVAVIGATFAYYGATTDGSESATTIEVTSGTLEINHNTNKFIKGSNVNPGEVVAQKEFTVNGIVTGSSNLNYEVVVNVKNNTYSDGALVYTLTSKNTSNNGRTIAAITEEVAIPSGASKITLGAGAFAGPTTKGSTHSYVLTVIYKNEDSQNANASKIIDAELAINQIKK